MKQFKFLTELILIILILSTNSFSSVYAYYLQDDGTELTNYKPSKIIYLDENNLSSSLIELNKDKSNSIELKFVNLNFNQINEFLDSIVNKFGIIGIVFESIEEVRLLESLSKFNQLKGLALIECKKIEINDNFRFKEPVVTLSFVECQNIKISSGFEHSRCLYNIKFCNIFTNIDEGSPTFDYNEFIGRFYKKNIRSFDLWDYKTNTFPPNIFNQSNLRSFGLKTDTIRFIPDKFDSLPLLSVLNMESNLEDILPPSLLKIKNEIFLVSNRKLIHYGGITK